MGTFDCAIALTPPFIAKAARQQGVGAASARRFHGGIRRIRVASRRSSCVRRTRISRRRCGTASRWMGGRSCSLRKQGYGDMIQFIRYAPLVAAAGGKVIVACVPELANCSLRRPASFCASPPQDSPRIDVQCPILSLPHRFATSLQNIPADVPYLVANPGRIEKWKSLLPRGATFHVGLAWASHPTGDAYSINPARLKLFSPLAELQKHRVLQPSTRSAPRLSRHDRSDQTRTRFRRHGRADSSPRPGDHHRHRRLPPRRCWARKRGRCCRTVPICAGCSIAAITRGIRTM